MFGETMKTINIIFSAIFGLAVSTAVVADEVWDSTKGKVVYELDIGPTAIWSYRTKDYVGLIHLAGLAGIHTNRGSYEGYWVQNDSIKECVTERPTQNGETTKHWGRFHIRFIDKDFPSRWEAQWGYCNDELEETTWEGKPVS